MLVGATSSCDSIFTYDEGKKHSSYFNAEYVPMFLNQANFTIENATLGQQAKDVCGDSILCLFDVHTTGKISIGKATKQAMEVLAANINDTQTPGKVCVIMRVKESCGCEKFVVNCVLPCKLRHH